MTTSQKSKPTILNKLTAATTKDGRLLPLSTIANKGLVSLAVFMLGLFVAGTLIIILLSNPAIPAALGGIAITILYFRRYGAHLPPQLAEILDQRRVAREASAAPSTPATKRVPQPRQLT